METYLDLSKGLHTDFDPINQPAGTYRYLKNAIRQLSGAIENEKGTSLLHQLSDNSIVVGSYVLDTDTIFFSFDGVTEKSEIGVLSADNTYTTITTDDSLGFSENVIVNATGKRNFKGERIIYFTGRGLPMRIINLDNVPATNFNDNTKLILTADMPQIALNSVIDGGTLPTGIYQFGVRLLTKSTNSTSISLLTNPIPVVDEDTSNRDRMDGAPPQSQSNKAISLNVTNIDTDYEFIEIVAITYIGTANITKATVIARLPIQGRSTLEFVYSTITQSREEIDMTGLVVDAVNYDSAEFIIQKDGVLILGGVTTSSIDYNFQSAANLITLKYMIKEVPYNENISISNGVDVGTSYVVGEDYKNANTSTNLKSFMRDEVYSFAISPIFTNWSIGAAYHIPAPTGSDTANTTTKQLGTYTSLELYPTGRDYPAGSVRHHKMPSLIQEPHVQRKSGTTYVRMLGVEADITQMLTTLPDAIKKQVIGYVITKQKRDDDNKSILTQGIATGHSEFSPNRFNSIPFSGKTPYKNLNLSIDNNIVAFYSPETIITKENMRSVTSLKPVLEMTGTSHLVKDKRTGDDKFAYVLMDYSHSTTDTSILSSVRTVDPQYTQYIEAGAEATVGSVTLGSMSTSPIIGTANSIITWRNPGYLFMKLSGNTALPIVNTNFGGKADIFYESRSGTDRLYFNNVDQGTGGNGRGTTNRHLYNLTRTRDRQYGNVFDAKYHYVKHIMMNGIQTSAVDNSVIPNTKIQCFNGDTFITKFSVMSSMNTSTEQEDSADLKGLSYVWLESTINTGYRHYKEPVGKEGDSNYEAGTIPYYPKVKLLHSDNAQSLGIFNYSSSLGHPVGYNKQYSFENTIRAYFPIALELEPINTFDNRLIYSEKSIEGEQLDAFRIILTNNYHDIPKEKGKLTNLFILANTLYAHTQRSLWKTYFNESVTQATSAGDVYLGNGGIFYRPSTEITTVKGGYGGTNSSSGTTTPFGHFFIDDTQKKAFLFGEELKEISDQGMFKWFKNNVEVLEDKPLTGYTSVFDYTNKRWLLTRKDEWTISYSAHLNSWSSYHDYIPYHYLSNGDRMYSVKANGIHEMNVDTYGVYYGEVPSALQLDIVVNDVANETKVFDNLVLYTTSERSGKEQHYDTFNTLQCYNVTSNTGKCRLIVPRTFEDEFISLNTFEAFAKLKSNEFRVAIPSNLVIDANEDIFDENNLHTDRLFRPRIKGKYMIASLTYNNLRDNRFVLHNIGRLFRQNIR